MCNLTTLNMFAFVNEDGTYDKEAMLKAQIQSARMGYNMASSDFELPDWDEINKRDMLVGCSLSGVQDFLNATNISNEEYIELLKELREVAHKEIEYMAEQTGQNKSLLVTSIKPAGTTSNLFGESPGIHLPHSPYYIRRVRVSAVDPILQVCRELKYPIHPEVGYTEENAKQFVVEFPIKTPDGRNKYNTSAIDQLEMYKLTMKHYIDHNISITVSVRDEEWADVEEWVYNNWDDCVALSFLSLDDSFYELLPYETCTQEEYENRNNAMKKFRPMLIAKYERQFYEAEADADCEAGVCPVK